MPFQAACVVAWCFALGREPSKALAFECSVLEKERSTANGAKKQACLLREKGKAGESKREKAKNMKECLKEKTKTR